MSNPILIGLHSVKRGGKNTTADFIEKFAKEFDPPLSVVQRGFADKGKLAFARQFFPAISMQEAIAWCDKYNNNPNAIFTSPSYTRFADDGWPQDGPLGSQRITFRQALAQFCTEGARDVYGNDFWVDQLLPNWPADLAWTREFMVDLPYPKASPDGIGKFTPESAPANIALITDVRFPNELVRIKQVEGWKIKIRRKDAEDAVIAEAEEQGRDVHASELGIPDEEFDFIINNDDNDLVLAEERTRHVFDQIMKAEGHAN